MPRRRSNSVSCGGLVGAVVIAFVLISLVSLLAESDAGLVVLILGIGVVVLWLVRRFSGPKTPTAQELARRFEMVRAMSGPQFEAFVADLFRAMGHRATVLGGAGDQGVDVIVGYQRQRVAVQCKNYAKRVRNAPVQQVVAGARHHGCSEAWVVAPAGYTSGAIALAESNDVTLFDADDIRRWIRAVDKAEMQRRGSPENDAPNGQPRYCPNCGTETREGDTFCRSCGKRLPSQVEGKGTAL